MKARVLSAYGVKKQIESS